jgi:DNA-binding response OmpR family regulator
LLIVEDEPASQVFLEHALRAWYRTDTAVHVQDGIRKSIDRRYDGFLVDIGLRASWGDGIDMLEYLRAERTYVEAPIIAVTGHVLPGDRAYLLETGFDAYLGKPFFRGDLLTMLDRFFDHRLSDA